MQRQEALQTLRSNLSKLDPSSQQFASSLLEQEPRRGLSEKQWPWVIKLAERATQAEKPREAVGSLTSILALFAKAERRLPLKTPAVLIKVDGMGEVRVSVASERSRKPGTLNVVATGTDLWFGRILKDGSFEESTRLDPQDKPAKLLPALRAFAENPAMVAGRYGRLTGRCCFCNRKLKGKDGRSTAVGYGPDCADNFGVYYPTAAEAEEIHRNLREAA